MTAAATAAAPKPDAVRPCGSRGDTDRPLQVPVRIGARLGPLVIWSSIRDPYLGSRGGAFPYFIKAPIVLPARTVATLAVPPAYRHLVAFEADASWVSSVEFHACRESTRAFPAAYSRTC